MCGFRSEATAMFNIENNEFFNASGGRHNIVDVDFISLCVTKPTYWAGTHSCFWLKIVDVHLQLRKGLDPGQIGETQVHQAVVPTILHYGVPVLLLHRLPNQEAVIGGIEERLEPGLENNCNFTTW